MVGLKVSSSALEYIPIDVTLQCISCALEFFIIYGVYIHYLEKLKLFFQVWTIRVDTHVLNYDGNLVDCCSASAIAALAHFRFDKIF
jgi:exosome complex RNA-binding protein Rrp42 (RNase PH superfamily)